MPNFPAWLVWLIEYSLGLYSYVCGLFYKKGE